MSRAETVAAIAASMSKPCPDAALIEACDAFRASCEEAIRRSRLGGKGYAAFLRESGAERDRLEAIIVNTPARTALGRRVKAEAAVFYMTRWSTGTIHALPRSALLDLLHASSGDAVEGGAQ